MSYLKINGQDIEFGVYTDEFGEQSHELDEKIKNIDISKIEFQMQNGPIKEVGINGLQVTDLIYLASRILVKFNKNIECEENQKTFDCLQGAIEWQLTREADRTDRGVEGTNEE